MKFGITIASLVLMLTASGCGFKPIYATPDGGDLPVNRQIVLSTVSAPEETQQFLVDAIKTRMILDDGASPKYSLDVNVTERAERLAVQIDNTTTRYNYRLIGRYYLTELATGKKINGQVDALTSYNIVSSQYATLFAERTAREKAARLLTENIERDILLRLSDFSSQADITPLEILTPDTIGEDPSRDPFAGAEEPFVIEQGGE